MAYKHRVTVRVTRLEGRQGSLTSSNIVYADSLTDITIPIADILDRMLQVDDNDKQTAKPKKK